MQFLKNEIILNTDIDSAWNFFATPANLNSITPASMQFKILDEVPDKMYEGMYIRYKIKPMINISMQWLTQITHISEKNYFIDEQIIGPYKLWHHEHHFKEVKKGVLMTDLLYYDIGMYFLGTIAKKLFVEKKVNEIFNFRNQKINQIFKQQ